MMLEYTDLSLSDHVTIYIGRTITECLIDRAHYQDMLQHRWHVTDSGYAARRVWPEDCGRYVRLYMHRVICELVHGPPPDAEHVADHINRNRLDNTSGNLRWLTKIENSRNR